jgi:hypothetical protein
MLSFVVHNELSDAVYLGVYISAPNVPQDPQFRLLSPQTSKRRNVAQRNSFVHLAHQFEVQKVESFNYLLFIGPQEEVSLNDCATGFYLCSGGLEVVLYLKEGDELSESVGVFDYFSVDDLHEFEQVKDAVVPVVLEGFVEDEGHNHVA